MLPMNEPLDAHPRISQPSLRAIVGFILLCTLFTLVWLHLPARNFLSPDEGAKYMQMRGMSNNPFEPCRILYPGIGKDPALFYYPARAESTLYSLYPYVDPDGRVQTNWLPWFPWITKPFFAWLGPRGLTLIPLLTGLLGLWLAGAVASRLEPRARRLTLAAFGLATPLLFYSLTFWEHAPALLLQLLALLYALPRETQANPTRFSTFLRVATIAALLAAAIALRREALFFAAGLGIAAGWQQGAARLRIPPRWRIPGLCLALAALVLLLVLPPWLLPNRTGLDLFVSLYRAVHIDTWFSFGTHFFNVFFLLNEEESPLPHLLRWTGQIGLLICIANALWPRARKPGVFCAGILLVLVPALFLAATPTRYRALHSLVLSAPFVLFALLPAPAPQPRPAAERLVRTTTILFAVFLLLVTLPAHRAHGGLEWGARYAFVLFTLLPAIGAVNVCRWLASPAARGWKRIGMHGLVLLALLLGSVSMVRGVRELGLTRRDLGRIEAVLAAKAGPIVTDWGWLASAITDLYLQREVYTLDENDELHGWLDAIGKNEPFFLYASYEPLPEKSLRREKDRLEPVAHEVIYGLDITTYRIAPGVR